MTTISEKKLLKLGEDFKKLQKENEKLNNDLFKRTSFESYFLQNEEDKDFIDYIEFLEFRKDDEKECLDRATERYKSLMITLKENRKLKQENEELKEENEKLKEKYDNLYTECEEHEDQIDWEQFNNEKLQEEIKKLKEELKLKDEIISLHETEERGLIQVVDFYKLR